ncbi:MAG: hypothetical protein QXI71_03515 [Candidatus Bathyarchaeia archaeon]
MSAETIVYSIIIFAVFAVAIILYVAKRSFRSPNVFYAPQEATPTLAAQLTCPRCRERKLKPTSEYTFGCENCGFTFSVGAVSRRDII